MERLKLSSIRQAQYSLSLNNRDVFSTLLGTVALLAQTVICSPGMQQKAQSKTKKCHLLS